MTKTNYYQAKSVSQAVEYLKEYRGQAMLLAGGTDVMVQANQYAIPEETVFIGIEDIQDLKQIRVQMDGIHVGSMVTDNDLIESDVIRTKAAALYMAALESASPQVRNRATVGGNVATASPSGDVQAALIALGATAVIVGENGTRTIPVEEIPVHVKKTCLDPTEIITEFIIPVPDATEGSCFVKMGKRKAMTISIVDVAAKVKLSADKQTIESVVIVAGACAPTVVRLSEMEKALIGQPATEKTVKECAPKALENVSPITDMRATEWYRKETVQVFAERAVNGAIANVLKEV